jgi:major membrane immunogen (membrane-anchored lipoprotein)
VQSVHTVAANCDTKKNNNRQESKMMMPVILKQGKMLEAGYDYPEVLRDGKF